MKLTLAEPKYLKDSISIISELVNEAKFKVTPNAVELVAMDPANVAMVVFKLLSSCFTEYNVEGNTELSINLSNLRQILKRAKPNDTLSLELEENKLKIQLKGTSTRTFSLPILEIDEKDQKVPELNFSAVVDTDSTILSDAIEDADIVGESVSFVAADSKLSIQAEGDLSKADIDIPGDDNTKVQVEGSEALKAKYSIEYLKKMMASSKLADKVKVQFNKDYPLRLDYTVIDKVSLSFILAPRVEND